MRDGGRELLSDKYNYVDLGIQSMPRLKGPGPETAEYVLLRAVGDLSAFPGDDVGGRNKLQRWLGMKERLSYETVREITSKWLPFPGFIYFHLLLDELARKGYITEDGAANTMTASASRRERSAK